MLKGIHFLLSYACNMECDHCFVYSGPHAKGTFTLKQIREVLDELIKIGTIEWVYFEGGEPFMYYPLMLEGIRLAQDMNFKVGVVTNAYWVTSEEDAELWLRPLIEMGISDLSISDDTFHYEEENENPAKLAMAAAKNLDIPVNSICIQKPRVDSESDKTKRAPVIGGGALLKGRAAEKLVEGLPKRRYDEFVECSEEDLRDPERVHLDSYGYVHICQGLVIGNMWETPLSELVRGYDGYSHPICEPLLKGGPILLAEKYGIEHDEEYISACHFCFLVRLALLDKFPQYLAPRQIYGLE
ncbi:MAG: radical SAM protein [Thermoplasmata archaeon]|nr:MAG: radical SAM protein [Thermoplasmata archaeon]